MFLIIVYILLLVIMWRTRKNASIFTRFLYLAYLLSAICGLLLLLKNTHSFVKDTQSYISLLFLFVIVVIWSDSYRMLSVVPRKNIDYKSEKDFNQICNFVCAYFLPITLLLLYNAYHILTSVDVSVFRVEKDYYSYFVGGPFFSLSVYSSMLFFVPQFLYFYSYRYNISYIKRIILLVCSFSFTFMTLCFAGRDGIVYWFMNSLVFYYFLRGSYQKRAKKHLKKVFLILGSGIMVIFLAITFLRFVVGGGGESSDMLWSIINYAGQQVHIFCQTTAYSSEQLKTLESTDYLTMTFGTFVKELYTRYGYLGTVIISIIQLFVAQYAVKVYNHNHRLWDFFIVYLLFQIPLYGVFYYRQGLQSMEIVYGLAILLFLLLKSFKIKTLQI